MKVNELIQELKKLDQDTEIVISLRKKWRPYAIKSIEKIDEVIDQDKNKLGYYAIDIDSEI